MKRNKILILSIILSILLAACSQPSKENISYQFPELDMTSNKEQVMEFIQKQADTKNIIEDKNTIVAENNAFMGIYASKIQFNFMEDKLVEIRLRFPATNNSKVKTAMEKTYPKPVSSFQPADINYMILPKTSSVPELLDREYISSEKSWVWHPDKSFLIEKE